MLSEPLEFDQLISKVVDYMTTNLKISDSYLNSYKFGWRKIRFYLSLNNYVNYKPEYQEDIIKFLFEDKIYRKLNDNEQLTYRSILQLTEFITTGKIILKYNSYPNSFEFSGKIGKLIVVFLDTKKFAFQSHKKYMYYTGSLHKFYMYCKKKKISEMSKLNIENIFDYVSNIDTNIRSHVMMDISSLKQFLKYLYHERLVKKDLSEKIPYLKRVQNEKLPSVYTPDEIKTFLNTFNRTTRVGKRNFAIALLATHLGMRASDIANLKFDNINWSESELRFTQMKTQELQSLPLISDVGNAIIDYLENSRPVSDLPFVFLTLKPPFKKFGITTVSHIVQRAFKKTGINISCRKFGSHSLRHSLVSRLLEKRTLSHVISEVLGHTDSDSLEAYINIDLKTFEILIVDVPSVDLKFYSQKGGVFYR